MDNFLIVQKISGIGVTFAHRVRVPTIRLDPNIAFSNETCEAGLET
jgi:hypothetical protein